MEKTTTFFNKKQVWGAIVFRVLFMAMFFITTGAFAQFNDGYLTVYKATSSSALAGTGATIVVEEYIPTTTGQSAPNYSVTLPTGTDGVVVSGSATSAGAMSRSENGRYLVVPGYAAAAGDANSTFTTNGTARTLSGSGAFGLGVKGAIYSASNDLRGAASDDGTNFWFTGGNLGIRYTNNGTTVTTVSSTTTNTRVVNIFNGQLFYSTGSGTNGVYQVGTGKPVAASTTSTNIVTSSGAYGFSVSPDGRTIYTLSGTGTVVRYTYSGTYNAATYTYSGGTWSSASTGFALAGVTGVAVDWNNYSFSTGANGAVVYAVNPTNLVRGADNGTGAITTTTLRTISGNNAFRGIAFSPISQTVSKSATSPAAASLQTGVSNAVLFGFTLTATEGNSNIKKLILSQLGTAVLGTDITSFRLIEDTNNNGVADSSEISAALSTGSVSGTQITFASISTTAIAQGNSKNFLVIGNISGTATSNTTFIPSIVSDRTVNSVNYTTNLVNGGGSYVTIGSSAPTGSTITIAAPIISYTGTLAALSTTQGTASSTTSFSISGQSLTAGISINPPVGFEISTTADFSANVGTNGSPITVGAAGNVAATTIYVRLAATTPAGNYSGDIVASSAGASNVNIATAPSTVTSASLSNQTITFPSIANATYGDASFTLNATASSGLAVTYTSSNTAIATVSANTVTITGVGTVTIYADQAGNGSYNPAPQVSQSFTIAPKSLTVTGAVVTARVYDGTTAATITGATLSGVLSGDTVTVSGNGTFTDANAGTGIPVTANLVLGGTDSGKYTLVQPSLTGTINKADQTITFGALPSKTTADADFAPGATSATSGTNAITYSSSNIAVATISGSTIHITGPGTSTITAAQAASQNYNAASATQTLTVIDSRFTDGNLAVVVAAASANNTTVSVVEVSPTLFDQTTPVKTLAVAGTGTSAIRVSGSATSTLYVANSADGQRLLFTGHNSTDATSNVNTLLTRAVVSVSHTGGVSLPTTYTGTSGQQTRGATTLDNTNYYIADQSGLFTNGATARTQATNLRAVKPFGGVVYGATATTIGTFTTPVGPTATAYATLTGVATETALQDFYMISTANNGTFDVLYVLTATSNTAGVVKKYSLVSGSWTANGSYTTTFGGFGISAKKEGTLTQVYITTGQGALVANKIMRITDTTGYNQTLSVTTADNKTLYTAAANTIIKGIAFAPLSNAPVVNSTTVAAAQVGQAFSYSITATNTPTSYNATGLAGTGLSVDTTTGVISGTPTAVGTISVTISATNADGTGTATLLLTVNPGNQTITFPAIANATYGDAPIALTATASSGLAVTYTSSNTAIATVSGSVVTVVGVGEVTIYANQAGNSNYNAATQVSQNLIVAPKALTVSNALVTSKTYDGTTSATITGATLVGVVSGDVVTVSGSGTFADANAADNISVTANLVLAGEDSANYTLTQPTLTGNITKADQVITFNAIPTKTTADADFAPGATSPTSAINEITYTSSNTAVATIVAGAIHIVGTGTATITATQAESQNYNAATATQTLTVVPPPFTTGNLIAVVAAASVNNTTATVIEINPAATQTTPVNTVAIPGTGTSAIRISGSATSTGYVSNSADGTRVLFTGVNNTNTSSNANTLNPRAVVSLKRAGASSLSIATTYTGGSGNQTRSATTIDNVNYFIADQGGLYTNNGTAAATSGNYRGVKSFGNAVYAMTSTSIGTVSNYTGGTFTAFSGIAFTNPTDFYLVSSANNGVYDVLYYIVNGTGTSNTNATYYKYVYNGSSWVAKGTYATTTIAGFGLVAKKEGANINLYVTTGAGAQINNSIVRLTDAGGTDNINITGTTTLYTATGNAIIKGLGFAPTPEIPAITSGLTATAQVGQVFTYNTIATNSPTSYSATGLAGTGLSINTTTGVISGTPTTTAVSPINVVISATNADGTGTANLVITVNQGSQVITFNALTPVNDDAADFDLTATSSSGLAVTYTSSNPSVATIVGNTVQIIGAGSADITASQAGNADYLAAVDVVQTLVVNSTALTNQTITFPAIANVTYGDASFTLGATASSGLPVSYTSSNTAVATVSGNTVTIVGVGDVTIYADQEGNSTYNPAAQQSQAFTVAVKTIQVVGAVVQTRPYDGTTNTTIDISAATLDGVVSGDEVSIASVTGTYIYGPDAGVDKYVEAYYVLTGADSANYTAAHALYGTVTKADQVINFAAIPNKTTLDPDFSIGATSASSAVNPLTYTSSNTAVGTITEGTIHIVGAGTSTITVSQAGNQNYNAASVSRTLTVLTPQFTAGNIIVLRAGSGSAALSNASTPVYLSEYTTSGTATVTIPVPADTAGNRLLISGSATSEGQLNLSGDGQYLTIAGYDAPVGIANIASSSSGTYSRVVGRMSANAQFAITSLGSSLYTGNNIRSAVTQDGSRYWTAGASGGVYTIQNGGTAATQVVSTPANTRTVSIFGGQLYVSSSSGTAAVYTVGTGLPTASTTATATVATADPYAYAIVDRGSGVRNMYVVASTSGVGLTKWVSTSGGAWTQVGTSLAAGSAQLFGVAARVNGNNVEIYASAQGAVYSLTDTSNATTAITGSFTQIITAPTNTLFRGIAFAPALVAPVITNTNLAVTGTINVAISDYAITAVNAPASYNATGLPQGVTVNTQTGVISGTPQHAGTYTVTLSATNAAGTGTQTLTMTIAKGDQSIVFGALDPKDVNDPDFDLTATSATSGVNPIVYTSSNTAVATVSGATVHIVGVGSTVITASQPATSDYNEALSVSQTLVVTSASLANQTITFDSLADQTYGNSSFQLTATASSGLPVTYTSSNPAIVSISGNTVTILSTGTVNITASQQGDSNYNAATDVAQPLNVLAKPLTVTGATVTTRTYVSGNTTATITGGTLQGVVGTDQVTLVNGGGTFADANAGTDLPVTSSFSITGAQAYRYTIVQPTLTGTITKANQSITFAAFPLKSDLEPATTLTSFSATSSINPVTYTSSTQTVASISGGVMTITGIGIATITASQAESQNYNAVSVSQTLTVARGLYLNQFTGASACPTNGNVAVTSANATGTEVSRSTILCNPTANVFNSTTLNATATVNTASYIEFSVSAAAGYKLNLNSLYMMRQASNSAPNQLEIRYSTDNFATYTSYTASPSPTSSNTPTASTAYTNWDFADFSSPVGGTVTFRLYPYGTQRVDGTGTSSGTGTFRIDDLTVFGTISSDCYTWTGAASADWNTAANWCGNMVPTVFDDVTIAATATNPVITAGTANSRSLTLNAATTLTVVSGATLNVVNALNVDATATLTVQDNAALLQGASTTANSNTGNIVFNKKGSSLYRLDYTLWSSPVAGQNLLDFSPATSTNRFYEYRSATDAYGTVVAGSTDFAPAKGYLIRMPNADSTTGYNEGTTALQYNGEFTGTPNNGTVNIPLSIEGGRFTAVGNPYPSPINLADFFTANAQALDSSTGIYLWRKRNGSSNTSYATLSLSAFVANPSEGGGSENSNFYANVSESASWLIAPAQGFIVKASATATTAPSLAFTNSMRRAVPSAGTSFFRHATDTASRLWLNLTAQGGSGSQVAVAYMEGATTGFDLGYDARKFAEANGVSFYSIANNTPLTIQARPGFETTDVVPMGYSAPSAGTYTVAIDHVDGVFANGQHIYLKDNLQGTVHDLATDYTFATEAGTFEGRFEVVYTNEVLGTDNPVFENNNIVVYKEGKVIAINSGNATMNNVTVYDIRGRKLYSQSGINTTTLKISSLTAEQQVLIVEVDTVNGKVSKRIIF